MNDIIYFLKNPNTQEIFYVGATTLTINKRLKQYYSHLTEYKLGGLNWKFFKDCNIQIQDIVQSIYESK